MGNNLQEKRPFIFKNPKGWYMSCERKSVSKPQGLTTWGLTKEGALGSHLVCPLTPAAGLSLRAPWPMATDFHVPSECRSAHCWPHMSEAAIPRLDSAVGKSSSWNRLPLICSQRSSFDMQHIFSAFLKTHSKYLRTVNHPIAYKFSLLHVN